MRFSPRLLLLAGLGRLLAGPPVLLWPQDEVPQRPAPQATAIPGDLSIGPDRPRGPLPGARPPQVLLVWSGGGGLDVLGGQFPAFTLTNTDAQLSLLLSGVASGFAPQSHLDGGATHWSAPAAIGARDLSSSQATEISFTLFEDAPERFRLLGYPRPRHLEPGDACAVLVEVDDTAPTEARLDVLLDGQIRHSISLTRAPSPETAVR